MERILIAAETSTKDDATWLQSKGTPIFQDTFDRVIVRGGTSDAHSALIEME